jgi:hypothetical protein
VSTDAVAPDLPRRQPGTTGLSWNEDPSSGWNADAAIWSENGAAAPFQPADAPADASGTAVSAGAGQDIAQPSVAGPTGTWPNYAWPAEPAPAEPAPAEADLAEADLAEAPASASTAEAGTAASVQADTSLLELDGLPVRVRQANLAPQLRQQPAMTPAEADEPAAGPSPEAARSTMAALQLGWQRGRSVTEPTEDELPAEPSPQDPGDSPDEGGSL